MILPDVGVQWRLSNARPERLPDGSTLWYGIITDITDKVLAEQELIKLSSAIEQSPATVVITAEDNGLGIDLEMHGAKVFGLYKIFHKNTDSKGLGLFITKNQIEAMGGTITVSSQVDVGTTFVITLPNEKP